MKAARKAAAPAPAARRIRDGQSAQAFFHTGWRSWTVGFYVPGYVTAASYTTFPTEAEAEAHAARFNALRGRAP